MSNMSSLFPFVNPATIQLLPLRETVTSETFVSYALYGYIASELLYFFWSFIFYMIDRYASFEFLKKYKLQGYKIKDELNHYDWKRYAWSALIVLRNHILISFPVMLVFIYLFICSNCPRGSDPFPHWVTLLYQIIVILSVQEIGFYYSHRLMHEPWGFRHIHRIHHEWDAPVAVVATYCHPIEHLISNLLPLMIGPLLVNAHMNLTMAWLCVAITNTCFTHSGYSFFFLSAENHDHHHQYTKCNFGSMVVLDWLHGTRYEDIAAARVSKALPVPILTGTGMTGEVTPIQQETNEEKTQTKKEQ